MTQKFIDRDGLKVLWNQVNLKDYPNNETLMAVIDAIDETKADKDELFSKSWNDLTDRPFYSEETEKWVIDKQEVTFDNSSFVSMRGLSDDFITLFNTVGSHLKVYWNGSIYECEVKYHNIAYYNYIDFADRRAYLEADVLTISNTTAELETQTYEFGVFVPQETVKTLDEKFIPKITSSWNDLEDKPFGEYAEEFEIADKEIPFTSNSYRYYHGSLLSEPANKISVYWNGIKYECESIFIDDIRYGYGNCRLYGDYYDSGEPFALIFDTTNGNTTVIKNNNETETVFCKIAGYEEGIKLIDDKYISYKLVRNYDVLEAANQNSSSIDYSPRNPHNLATKEYVDDLELITIEDINTICGISIQKSEEVLF